MRFQLKRVCLTVSCHDTMAKPWRDVQGSPKLAGYGPGGCRFRLMEVSAGTDVALGKLMVYQPWQGAALIRFLLLEPAVVPLYGTRLCDQGSDPADQLMALQFF